ncbi:MAG: plasmid recombination protein, partial [Lachnospiraceae bacterium]|nr:plasmid recombination protein [Lachnospiraceae bacterium]
MTRVSYSAHISNGKSAITSKSKLSGVAKHNLRKYRSKGYDRDNIILLFGSTNLLQDVKKVYRDTFAEALEQYNSKQTRADRKIEDYFEHVSGKNQDMAVEIIFQCGDKEFWECLFSAGNEERQSRENICEVYKVLLEQLQQEMPYFKIANAVVHFDEASPHMHVVGVTVGSGFKRGLETKVSKRTVFSPWSLKTVLQDHLRETAETQVLLHYGVSLKEKQKGKNHDLTIAEYKVQQETKRLWQLEEFLDEREDKLYDTNVRLDQTEREVSEMEKLLTDTKTELAGAEKELVQIKEESKETKQKLAEELQSFSGRYDRMRDNFDRIQERKEGLLAYIHVLDGEIDKRIDFINVLDRLREIIDKLLSMIPVVREFVRFVEDKRDIKAASPYGYTPLGTLLRQYRTSLHDRFVIFPEVASWQTSKGEV